MRALQPRASRLPGYLAICSSHNVPIEPRRTQSGGRKPVATTAATGLHCNTPPSTSSDTSLFEVAYAGTPTSTNQPITKRKSHLRPPKTIVTRHQSNVATVEASTRMSGLGDRQQWSSGVSGQTGSSPTMTSDQAGSRSRDGAGQRSRLVAPRTCVHR